MPIVKLPVYEVYDERRGVASPEVVKEYQKVGSAVQRFKQFSGFVLEQARSGELTGLDTTICVSVLPGYRLSFLYRNPWAKPRSLPYEIATDSGRNPPETRQLPHNTGLVLDTLTFDVDGEHPFEAEGRHDGGVVSVTFDDVIDLSTYVALTRNLDSPLSQPES